MDECLFEQIYQNEVPHFNKKIVEGLASHEMPKAAEYISKVWRCAVNDLPGDLRYLGWDMTTPQEAYLELTRRKKHGKQFEIAHSSVYMVKYKLEWRPAGAPQFEAIPPRYQLIPYCNSQTGPLIKLRGAQYDISPVMTDKAVSVGIDHIFIPVTRAKMKFERELHHFIANGETSNAYVIWAPIYRRPKPEKGQPKPVVKAKSTLTHYLFCKYGVSETFKRYSNAEVIVGFSDTVNATLYPESDWFVCRSTNIKPNGIGRGDWIPSDVRLAIRKSDWNARSSGMVAGFFYCLDYFPHRIHPEDADDIRLWRALMGHIVISTNESEGKLVEGIDVHMRSLDNYIDELAREDLQSDAIYVNDLYDLFAELIGTFPKRLLEDAASVSSLYGKQLRILRYVMMPIQQDIFYFLFEMKKKIKPTMTTKDISKIMNRLFKTERALKISYNHAEVRPISLACDNMAIGITCKVVPQTESTATMGGKKSSMSDPSKLLDASLSEVGGYLNLPKSEPSGRSRINPYTAINSENVIVRKEHMRNLIDRTQALVRGVSVEMVENTRGKRERMAVVISDKTPDAQNATSRRLQKSIL